MPFGVRGGGDDEDIDDGGKGNEEAWQLLFFVYPLPSTVSTRVQPSLSGLSPRHL